MAEKLINAIGAAIIEDGKVFLTKSDKDDTLIFPYGIYEADEGAVESLEDTMKDKYGVEVEVKDFIHTSDQEVDEGVLVLSVYEAEVKDGQLPEGDEYVWIDTDNLKDANLAPICDLIAVRIRNEYAV